MILITGGTGYVGGELLHQAGRTARGVSTRDFDVREPPPLDGYAAVIHTAYRQKGPEFREINVEGSRAVARAAAAAGARLIHVSTDVVFSGRKGGYTENDAPDPVTEYGESKAAAEEAVRAEHPRALIVRTSLVYGGPGHEPGQHELSARDPQAAWFTDERRNPVQVADLAAALLELTALEITGVLHVAGADAVSRCEFARLVAGPDVRCTTSVEAGLLRPLDCTLDSSRAAALLRTRLRGCREVLA